MPDRPRTWKHGGERGGSLAGLGLVTIAAWTTTNPWPPFRRSIRSSGLRYERERLGAMPGMVLDVQVIDERIDRLEKERTAIVDGPGKEMP